MRFIGVDLHKRFLVAAAVDEDGQAWMPQRFECQDITGIREFFEAQRPFQAVIEASASYRWLWEMVHPLGAVVLAHPRQLRAITSGRAKTDKLDATLLARLLRGGLIPRAYVPPRPYYELRELARARARLSRRMTEAKNELHALLARSNRHSPFTNTFCQRGLRWVQAQELGPAGNAIRDELIRRLAHFAEEARRLDEQLNETVRHFPECEALMDLHGIGRFSALLIVGELGEPGRFRDARAVGAYAGLTPRVSQSGEHCYYGHITRQGSPWLRWVLVQAAMHLVRRDQRLRLFYQRIRKRSSGHIARVAAARKLATICWIRLMRWHQLQPASV